MATPPEALNSVFGLPTFRATASSGAPPPGKPPMPYTLATPSTAALPPTLAGVAPTKLPAAFLVTTIWIAVSGGAADVAIVVVNVPVMVEPASRVALSWLVAVPVEPTPLKLAPGSVPSWKENDALPSAAAPADPDSNMPHATTSIEESNLRIHDSFQECPASRSRGAGSRCVRGFTPG